MKAAQLQEMIEGLLEVVCRLEMLEELLRRGRADDDDSSQDEASAGVRRGKNES